MSHIHPSISRLQLPIRRLRRPLVLGPHEIRHRLRFLVVVRRVAVVVGVRVVGGPDVLHAVDAAALGAAFDGAGAGHLRGFCWLSVSGEGGLYRECQLVGWGKMSA